MSSLTDKKGKSTEGNAKKEKIGKELHTNRSASSSLAVNNDIASLDDRSTASLAVNNDSAPLDNGSTAFLAVNDSAPLDNGSTASLAVNNDSAPLDDGSTALAVNNHTTSLDDGTAASLAANVNNDDRAMDVDARASTTDQTSNPVPMDVDQEIGEESTNIVAVAAPAWLTALKMDVYLQDCSDAKAWRLLVESLYKFEEGNVINGVCHYNCYTFLYTNFLFAEFTNYFTS